jgi:uncharacterized repeat protein (TIGR01451 family)
MKKLILIAFLGLAFANANSKANKTNLVTINLKSYQQKVVVDKKGKRVTKWVKPTKVVPGTIIKYENSIVNSSQNNLEQAVVTNKIDKNVIFLPKSIESKLKYSVKYSLDGKNFADAKELYIKKDGKKYLANPKDYRAVRFNLINIPANKTSKISYQVKVK